MGAHEVEDRADPLARRSAQAPAELLEEQRGALGGAQHEDGVDSGHVDALVEQVDREHRPNRSLCQVPQGGLPLVAGAVAPDGHRRDPVGGEVAGHEAGVVDAHAEPEAAHRGRGGVLLHLLDDEASPGVGARVGGAEGVDVVAPASLPGDVAQVEAVVDAEVHEGRQLLLVDGVPQAQLGGDAVVEPVEDGQAVAPLGGGGEAEQLDGGEVVEHLRVRGGGGVVELVDDHHVEVIGREVGEVGSAEALDRGEDVLEALRP